MSSWRVCCAQPHPPKNVSVRLSVSRRGVRCSWMRWINGSSRRILANIQPRNVPSFGLFWWKICKAKKSVGSVSNGQQGKLLTNLVDTFWQNKNLCKRFSLRRHNLNFVQCFLVCWWRAACLVGQVQKIQFELIDWFFFNFLMFFIIGKSQIRLLGSWKPSSKLFQSLLA